MAQLGGRWVPSTSDRPYPLSATPERVAHRHTEVATAFVNKAIADQLVILVRTVETRVENLMRNLEVTSP